MECLDLRYITSLILMKNLLSVLAFLLLIGCGGIQRDKQARVPKQAIWKGGVDGGCWIVFNSVSATDVDATIFHENGEDWDKGIFINIEKCRVDSSRIIESIMGFDGQSIITNTGCSFRKDKFR